MRTVLQAGGFAVRDLPFPSVTVDPAAVEALRAEDDVHLVLGGQVHAGAGSTVSGVAGSGPRLVVSAHLDSKATTPGAFDNAAAVAVRLSLVEEGLVDLGPGWTMVDPVLDVDVLVGLAALLPELLATAARVRADGPVEKGP